MLATALGTACSGGGANRDVLPRATEPREVVAPRAEPTSTTPGTRATTPKVPRPGLGGVRPPPVLDRGSDHLAITKSLLMYARWLDAHDPDQALLVGAYQHGTALARSIAADWATMRRRGWRIIEIDRAPLDFFVLSETGSIVSYRVVEHLASRDLVDLQGRSMRRDRARDETYLISAIRITPGAPWRLLDVERKGPPIEVQL